MSDKTHFHFTGICGTAMGAVAAAMKPKEENGKIVRTR
jgi:UDP-N-acetylmuramate-alanine ligase